MNALLKCTKCGATVWVRVIEDDFDTNSFVHADPPRASEWNGFDLKKCCIHKEYEVIDTEYDQGD